LTDLDAVRNEIAEMAGDAVDWLQRRAMLARTVTIKVRYGDFTTITRSHSAPPTRDRDEIVSRAVHLLERTDAGRRSVRLLGVSVHNLSGESASDPVAHLPFDNGRITTRDTTDTAANAIKIEAT
jgi:DNA polymerase-4